MDPQGVRNILVMDHKFDIDGIATNVFKKYPKQKYPNIESGQRVPPKYYLLSAW